MISKLTAVRLPATRCLGEGADRGKSPTAPSRFLIRPDAVRVSMPASYFFAFQNEVRRRSVTYGRLSAVPYR